MLRDNLAGLIEPMLSSAAAHNLGGHPKRDKLGDAVGRPTWRSSLLSDPSAKFSVGNRATGEKNEWPGFKVTTQAHDSRAVRTAQHKSHRTIDPQCLENPRPEGAESTLTGNAASPFPAEPRQFASPRKARMVLNCTVAPACNVANEINLVGGHRGRGAAIEVLPRNE